jgi:hypothetical protein
MMMMMMMVVVVVTGKGTVPTRNDEDLVIISANFQIDDR